MTERDLQRVLSNSVQDVHLSDEARRRIRLAAKEERPVTSKKFVAIVLAVMLALTVRLYRRYHTLDIDEITQKCRMEDEPDIITIGDMSVRVEGQQMLAFEARSLQQSEALLKAETEDEPDIIVIGNLTVPADTQKGGEG